MAVRIDGSCLGLPKLCERREIQSRAVENALGLPIGDEEGNKGLWHIHGFELLLLSSWSLFC